MNKQTPQKEVEMLSAKEFLKNKNTSTINVIAIMEEYHKYASQFRQPKGWISVEDRLPEIGIYVLINIGEDTCLKGKLLYNGWVAPVSYTHLTLPTNREV